MVGSSGVLVVSRSDNTRANVSSDGAVAGAAQARPGLLNHTADGFFLTGLTAMDRGGSLVRSVGRTLRCQAGSAGDLPSIGMAWYAERFRVPNPA
jgi:hypothetical protein